VRILYLDCFSGISGDMTLAALVDAGADRGYIEQELSRLQIEPFTIEWRRVQKSGISALKMDVLPDPAHPPSHHRHYSEIVRHIAESGFSERVQSLSQAIFRKIGAAEAKIHGIPMEKVHFHEVGAIDSIVDVIGIALALDSLQVERIIASPVPLGSGTVRCDHGIYPVPAPATLEMMRGLPIAPTSHRVELTTPTGAGVISAVVDEFCPGLPQMIVESIGYGAGTRELPNQPNVLRAVIGRSEPQLGKWTLQPGFIGAMEAVHDHHHEHHEHHDHHHNHDHHDHHDHHHNHDHHHHHDHHHDDDHHHDRHHAREHGPEPEHGRGYVQEHVHPHDDEHHHDHDPNRQNHDDRQRDHHHDHSHARPHEHGCECGPHPISVRP
jgi:hypothetical protein